MNGEVITERIQQALHVSLDELQRGKHDLKAIEQVRVKYLGRKGLITSFFKQLGSLEAHDRPKVGSALNEARETLEKAIASALKEAKEAHHQRCAVRDITTPGRLPPMGRLHPITQVTREVVRIFSQMGFEVVEGPEVELDYYNFEALNPKITPPGTCRIRSTSLRMWCSERTLRLYRRE